MQEMQRIVAPGELGEPMHIEGHTSNENFAEWSRLNAESSGGGAPGTPSICWTRSST
jgi:hypothetical protein